MRIAVFADVWFPDTTGGAGRMATQSSVELARRGHEVHVVTRNTHSAFPQREQVADGVTVHRFPFPGVEVGVVPALRRELRGSVQCFDAIGGPRFDVAVIHQCLPAFGPHISGRLRGVPSVYYFHSPWHEEFLIRRLNGVGRVSALTSMAAWMMRRMERRILRRSGAVVVLSRYMAGKVTEYHQPPPEKVVRIPGGVDLARFRLPEGGRRVARERLGLPQDKTIFLTVRNLAPRMGLENFIEAFAGSEALRSTGYGVIGGRGLLEERLRMQVREAEVDECMRLWGHVDEEHLPDLYGAADWFVLPTRVLEGFGLVIPEAWACGTPVIGTPQGGIPDVLGTLDGDYVVDGSDAAALRRKMEEMLSPPAHLALSARQLRDHAAEHFSWSLVADAFESLVRRVADEG